MDETGPIPCPDALPDQALVRDLGGLLALDASRIGVAATRQARRVILESLGWLVTGVRSRLFPDLVAWATASEAPLSAGPDREASAIAIADRRPLATAVFANAVAGDLFQLATGYRQASVVGAAYHPGRVVFPLALGLCEATSKGFPELVRATVIGYEVGGAVRGTDFYALSRHQPLARPPAESYAAGATVAALRGGDPARALGTVCHAGLTAPLGHDGHSFNAHHAMGAGTIAVNALAAHGIAGIDPQAPEIVHDPRLTPRLDPSRPGYRFQIQDCYFKALPGCRFCHGPAVLVRELASRHALRPEHIRAIEVRAVVEARYCHHAVGPASTRLARMTSIPYFVAVMIANGTVEPEDFEADALPPAIAELQSRVVVRGDDGFAVRYPEEGRPCRVEIRTAEGTFVESLDVDEGDPEAPFDEDALARTFLARTRSAGGSDADARVLCRSLLRDTPESVDIERIGHFIRRAAVP